MTSPYRQANLTFTTWHTAEQTAATHLHPLLSDAVRDQLIDTWWIIRKQPSWRLRYQPTSRPHTDESFKLRLQTLVDDGHLDGLHSVVYEPETRAFGGPQALQAGHDLFCLDSRHLLAHLATDGGLRRELTILLPLALLQGAGLDWYEQGDVWEQVAHNRPPDPPQPADDVEALEPALTRLLRTDTTRTTLPVPDIANWTHGFTSTGCELARLNHNGQLHRGLRGVLAHHIIFTWNRHGLPYPIQAITAATATRAVFGPDPTLTKGST